MFIEIFSQIQYLQPLQLNHENEIKDINQFIPIILSKDYDDYNNNLTNLFQENNSIEINNHSLSFLQNFYSNIFQSKHQLWKFPYFLTLRNSVESLITSELIRVEKNKGNIKLSSFILFYFR